MLLLSIAARNSLIWVEMDLQATPVGCVPVPKFLVSEVLVVLLGVPTWEHVGIDTCDTHGFSRYVRSCHVRLDCSTLLHHVSNDRSNFANVKVLRSHMLGHSHAV